jgi:myo-inositol-1(or 4)-monophosphatase
MLWNGSDAELAAHGVSDPMLRALEETAMELAGLAGVHIGAALGRAFDVEYKPGESGGFASPVSEVDRQVELLIRAELAERLPGHDVIGEESESRPAPDSPFAWVLDPVDGTANFVNGLPLFAASIGLLYRGFPVVGALWCSTTHLLRPGLYHARRGFGLCFDGARLNPRRNERLQRHLAGEPFGRVDWDLPWDPRVTGSAAIECAFAAAGLLRVTRLDRPRIWDVAGGVALVLAAGGAVLERGPGGYRPFTGFTDGQPGSDPAAWRAGLLLGEAGAVDAYAAARRDG